MTQVKQQPYFFGYIVWKQLF